MLFARKALVAGGTGLVGSELLALLGEDNRYARVTSLGRREVVTAGRVEHRVVSFDHLDRNEFPKIDDAYCCLGTTRRAAGSDDAFRTVDFDYVLAMRVRRNARAPFDFFWCPPWARRRNREFCTHASRDRWKRR